MLAFDVAVVGAGPAGLMAAIEAARRGRRTVLLEKNRQPGLKILISGGGRCNLTTTRSGSDLEQQYGARRGRFLRHALRSFPPSDLCALLEGAGVPLREEDLEKIFPVSQQARDIRDALVRLAVQAGAELRTGAALRSLRRTGQHFELGTDAGPVAATSVILATGGLSYPKTGATGDGYPLCRQFGHEVTPTFPALAPLALDLPWLRALQGIVLTHVPLAVLDAEGRELRRRLRPILFTHRGLSGPGPMDLAGDVEELAGAAQVRFDFAPELPADELERNWLAFGKLHGSRRSEALLPAHLPERLREALVGLAGANGTVATLERAARKQLLEVTKNLRLPVARSLGYDHAEVTRGGVALDEVDPRTMASRRQDGLFLCGELLDVDGPIGGFNFQAAFATGRLAGLSA